LYRDIKLLWDLYSRKSCLRVLSLQLRRSLFEIVFKKAKSPLKK
jgi:hypothetical protein